MIREYITEHLKKNLKDLLSLVLYDPEQQYRELLANLTDEYTRVFDFNNNILNTREEALSYYTSDLVQNVNARMLVYVPFNAPLTQQEQLLDPFYIFSFGGS